MPENDVQLSMIDGRDALLMVLVKPGSSEGRITVDAHCNGLDKMQAAKVLMHVARAWKAEAEGKDRCRTCGGPDGKHDPACVTHPDHTNGSAT